MSSKSLVGLTLRSSVFNFANNAFNNTHKNNPSQVSLRQSSSNNDYLNLHKILNKKFSSNNQNPIDTNNSYGVPRFNYVDYITTFPPDIIKQKMINDISDFYFGHDILLKPTLKIKTGGDGTFTYKFTFNDAIWKSAPYTNAIIIIPSKREIYVDYLNACININDGSIISGKDIMNTIIKYAKYHNFTTIKLYDAAHVNIIGCDNEIDAIEQLGIEIESEVNLFNEAIGTFDEMKYIYKENFHRLSVIELVATNNTWYGKNFGFVEDVDPDIAIQNFNAREEYANRPVLNTFWKVSNEQHQIMIIFTDNVAANLSKNKKDVTMRDCAKHFQELFKNNSGLTPNDCKALAIFVNSIYAEMSVLYPGGYKFPYDHLLKLDVSASNIQTGGNRQKRLRNRKRSRKSLRNRKRSRKSLRKRIRHYKSKTHKCF